MKTCEGFKKKNKQTYRHNNYEDKQKKNFTLYFRPKVVRKKRKMNK